MAITFSPANNKITIVGYTESVPCNFTDIFNADKAGTLDLFSGTPAINITLTTQIKPSDETALKIDFILASSGAGVGDTIDITGTDKDGNAQSETLTTEADGTFTTTKWYKTITDVDCNGFNAGTLTIRQGQWGVVWKTGDNQFIIDCMLYVGETGTTNAGHLISKNEQVTMKGMLKLDGNWGTANTFVIGRIVDLDERITADGSDFYFTDDYGPAGFYGVLWQRRGTLDIYGSNLRTISGKYCPYSVHNIINTNIFYGILSYMSGVTDRVTVTRAVKSDNGADSPAGTINDLYINNRNCAIRRPGNHNNDITVRNLKARNCNYIYTATSGTGGTGKTYLIDPDVDTWLFNWAVLTDQEVYRQCSFNLKVIDKDNNPIGNATVVLKDKDGNTADQKGFETTTNGDGEIAEQTVSYGYYNMANGNTLQSYSPHTLEIKKAGYQTYKMKFTLDEKFNEKIKLYKQVPLILHKNGNAINLDASNPVNMIYD